MHKHIHTEPLLTCTVNVLERKSSLFERKKVPKLRMSLGETEMTVTFVKTTIHCLQ